MIDIYESAVQETGRFGAFFERDDDTAYFYLLDMEKAADRIISALRVASAERMSPELRVEVKWSEHADIVGLFIDGGLIALFDARFNVPQGRMTVTDDEGWFRLN